MFLSVSAISLILSAIITIWVIYNECQRSKHECEIIKIKEEEKEKARQLSLKIEEQQEAEKVKLISNEIQLLINCSNESALNTINKLKAINMWHDYKFANNFDEKKHILNEVPVEYKKYCKFVKFCDSTLQNIIKENNINLKIKDIYTFYKVFHKFKNLSNLNKLKQIEYCWHYGQNQNEKKLNDCCKNVPMEYEPTTTRKDILFNKPMIYSREGVLTILNNINNEFSLELEKTNLLFNYNMREDFTDSWELKKWLIKTLYDILSRNGLNDKYEDFNDTLHSWFFRPISYKLNLTNVKKIFLKEQNGKF